MPDEHCTAMSPQVEYREIPGFPAYRIGNDGSAWTCKRQTSTGFGGCCWVITDEWKKMSPRLHKKGKRCCVVLYTGDGRPHSKQISHLVLEAFVGAKPPGMFALHDPDPDTTNNRAGNLR